MDSHLHEDMLAGEPQRTFDEFESLKKKGESATLKEWVRFECALAVLLSEFKWKNQDKQARLEAILYHARQKVDSFPEQDNHVVLLYDD